MQIKDYQYLLYCVSEKKKNLNLKNFTLNLHNP